MSSTLDLDGVAAFLHAAELSSFTRAAEALGTAQSLISTRIKKLEEALGQLLLQRHPRLVRLTAEGERFLPAARELMAAHERALAAFRQVQERIAIGISEQAVGADAPALLARLARHDPSLVIGLRIEPSAALEAAFERGELDVAVVRRLGPGRTGEVLRRDVFGWFGSPALARPDGPVPLVSLMPECRLRRHAMDALDRAGLPWREAFIGGGMAAVLAAVGRARPLAPGRADRAARSRRSRAGLGIAGARQLRGGAAQQCCDAARQRLRQGARGGVPGG